MIIYPFITLIIVHFMALLMPGPDFFIVTRTALAHGYKQSLFVSLGVGTGAILWSILSLVGLKTIFDIYPFFQILIMICGAFYLFFISFSILKSMMVKIDFISQNLSNHYSLFYFYKKGFFTNITNPKVILYFSSIFSSFMDNFKSSTSLIIVFLIISFETTLFFIVLARLFSKHSFRDMFFRKHKIIDTFCALIFMIFAVSIIYEVLIRI
ncbi:LysE family transporter [Campylobacter pinnipediorum]|uniref:Transporter, LysE family n=1 Tax=Campylobacter pinnipediorum subsp. pinnipediorum TaxID=1660067 RepID=A0AAX0LAE8_9BACT|nr:LysE family transporter [Campylobacter pinnipediorum]OPA77890.1 hypothetical protein BFG04_02945 [Campylobacter pinnipediorum subsp. pinnipediorum]